MKFTNERTNKSTELEIKHQPPQQEDEYHICIMFHPTVGQAIELLPDIETDQMLYEVK